MKTCPLPALPEKGAHGFEKAIPLILALILGLIIGMALTSGFDKHPDEKDHYSAAEYYLRHWLPPAVGAPETAASYSKYGYSYAHDLDFFYLLTAKFSVMLSPWVSKRYLAMRLFNVFLFFLLLLYCIFYPDSRPILLVVLITPQVWYIFSYINNDAIALFISLIITCELMVENSYFQRSLKARGVRQFIAAWSFMGLLLGLLFFCKRNYYIFIIFVLFIIFWQIWQNRGPLQRQMIFRYLAVLGLGLSIFLLRYGYDLAINGWDKAGKKMAYAEIMAQPQFKPSAIGSGNSWYGLRLRSKGLSYSEIFAEEWQWHRMAFRSFFGVYGYMKVFSSRQYYTIVNYVILLSLIYITAAILLKGERADKIFMTLVWLIISLSIFVSTYYSWVRDFQAQGRYLFPVLGMVGALLYQSRKILHRSVVASLVMVLCGLSFYSFLLTGLSQIRLFLAQLTQAPLIM